MTIGCKKNKKDVLDNAQVSVSSEALTYSFAVSSKQLNITSNTSWRITADVPWISFSSVTGTNNATLTVSISRNIDTLQRIGKITLTSSTGSATKSIKVTQAAGIASMDDLVAYYPFNGNANDESGNENNAAVVGATLTTDRLGNMNQAYSFNGVDNYLKVKFNNALKKINTDNSLTITSWINIKNWYQSWNCFNIICQYDWEFQVNKIPENIYLGTGNSTVAANWTPNFNQWYHVAITYSRAVGKADFYVDGSPLAQVNYTGGFGKTDSTMFIGYSPLGPTEYSDGKIDQIRIYNRKLTTPEIQAIYNEERRR
jgi:hypothetical protein